MKTHKKSCSETFVKAKAKLTSKVKAKVASRPKKPPIEHIDHAKVFLELPGRKVTTKTSTKPIIKRYVNVSCLLWISSVVDVGENKGVLNRFRIYFYAGLTGKERFTAYFDTKEEAEEFHKQYVKPIKARGYK
jgi:hypothetical protein